jgi:hypothetical protein
MEKKHISNLMEILFFIPIFRFPFALKMYETTNMYNSINDADWMLCNKKRRKYPLTSDVLHYKDSSGSIRLSQSRVNIQ